MIQPVPVVVRFGGTPILLPWLKLSRRTGRLTFHETAIVLTLHLNEYPRERRLKELLYKRWRRRGLEHANDPGEGPRSR